MINKKMVALKNGMRRVPRLFIDVNVIPDYNQMDFLDMSTEDFLFQKTSSTEQFLSLEQTSLMDKIREQIKECNG